MLRPLLYALTTTISTYALGCGGADSRGSASPAAWSSNPKVDQTTRKAIESFAAYNGSLPFDVVLERPFTADERRELSGEGVIVESDIRVLAPPRRLEALVRQDVVRSVTCSRLHVTDFSPAWTERVDARTAQAWSANPCWIMGNLTVAAPLDGLQREALGRLGVQSALEQGALDEPGPIARSALVPRDALPKLVTLPWVVHFAVEPRFEPTH